MFGPRISGVFAIWKPQGISSSALCLNLRERILTELGFPDFDKSATIKVAHGGTLDQAGSGVLAVGVGYACSKMWMLQEGVKKYSCTAELGKSTDTYDAQGTVTQEKTYDNVTRELLVQCVSDTFIGNILQKPPVYSSVMYEGRRLVDFALNNEPLPEIEPLSVTCQDIQITKFKPPSIELDVSCAGNFYIRSFIHDLGRELGTVAHCSKLIRTRHGPFTESDTLKESDWNVDRIQEAMVYSTTLQLRTSPGRKPKTYKKRSIEFDEPLKFDRRINQAVDTERRKR